MGERVSGFLHWNAPPIYAIYTVTFQQQKIVRFFSLIVDYDINERNTRGVGGRFERCLGTLTLVCHG